MKNTGALRAMGVAFVVVTIAAQSIANAQVTSPKGTPGFISETFIRVDGSVSQSEKYYWSFSEGEGNFSAVTSGTDDQGHAIIVTPGFQEGAEISYEQEYSATAGDTYFFKRLTFDRYQVPNLHVNTSVSFQGDPAIGSSLATYNERVGLAVISSGGDNTTAGSGWGGLLSLCPWASSSDAASGGGYPATSEIISAGSSFTVTNIHGFFSESAVVATGAPFLGYSVEALQGQGSIGVEFSAEAWKGTAGWGTHDIGICNCGPYPTGIYAINDPPQEAGRMSYSNNATADGVWTLTKNNWYQSSLLIINPLNLVP